VRLMPSARLVLSGDRHRRWAGGWLPGVGGWPDRGEADPFFPWLLQQSEVFWRDEAGNGLGVPSQDDPLMAVGHPVDQVR
jgi:hypothetical protein